MITPFPALQPEFGREAHHEEILVMYHRDVVGLSPIDRPDPPYRVFQNPNLQIH